MDPSAGKGAVRKRGTYTKNVCELCRMLKKKCDGLEPCGRCNASGHAKLCTYSSTKTKTKSGKGSRSNESKKPQKTAKVSKSSSDSSSLSKADPEAFVSFTRVHYGKCFSSEVAPLLGIFDGPMGEVLLFIVENLGSPKEFSADMTAAAQVLCGIGAMFLGHKDVARSLTETAGLKLCEVKASPNTCLGMAVIACFYGGINAARSLSFGEAAVLCAEALPDTEPMKFFLIKYATTITLSQLDIYAAEKEKRYRENAFLHSEVNELVNKVKSNEPLSMEEVGGMFLKYGSTTLPVLMCVLSLTGHAIIANTEMMMKEVVKTQMPSFMSYLPLGMAKTPPQFYATFDARLELGTLLGYLEDVIHAFDFVKSTVPLVSMIAESPSMKAIAMCLKVLLFSLHWQFKGSKEEETRKSFSEALMSLVSSNLCAAHPGFLTYPSILVEYSFMEGDADSLKILREFIVLWNKTSCFEDPRREAICLVISSMLGSIEQDSRFQNTDVPIARFSRGGDFHSTSNHVLHTTSLPNSGSLPTPGPSSNDGSDDICAPTPYADGLLYGSLVSGDVVTTIESSVPRMGKRSFFQFYGQ